MEAIVVGTVQGAITALQAIVSSLPGIRSAPEVAPEKMSVFPFAVAYPLSGQLPLRSQGWYEGLHTLILEIHVARKDLSRDISKTIDYLEYVPAALDRNPTLSGTVDTIVSPLGYTFGALDWIGDIKTLGFKFEIEVKISNENAD